MSEGSRPLLSNQRTEDYDRLAAAAKRVIIIPYLLPILTIACIHFVVWHSTVTKLGHLAATSNPPASQFQKLAAAATRALNTPLRIGSVDFPAEVELGVFTLLITLAIAFIVLIFPSFHVIQINRARDRLRLWPTTEAGAGFHDYVARIRSQSHLKAESQFRFGQHFGFALLITLTIRQVALPEGLDDFLLGEFLGVHALPGETEGAFFLRTLSRADPLVFGLAGYLLYTLTLHLRRLALGDISYRMLTPLFIRGVTVVLLGVVIAGTLTAETAAGFAKALLFAVGVFPENGLSYLSKLAQTGIERLSGGGDNSLRKIREIDLWKATALEESGIFNVSDFAKADGAWLLETQGINGAVFLRALDRAILLDTVGDTLATALEKIPVYGATELLLFCLGREAYRQRWEGLKVRFELGEDLDSDETSRRLELVTAILGVADIRLTLRQLGSNRNIWLILDNKIQWGNF